MEPQVRVKIKDMIFHLNNSKLSIYKNENKESCVIKHKSKLFETKRLKCIQSSNNKKPPFSIKHINNHLEVFFNETKNFEIFAYNGNEFLTNGTNKIDIPNERKRIVIGSVDQNTKEYVFIDSINQNMNNGRNYFINDLISPYSNKIIGNVYDANLSECERLTNILEKDSNFSFIGCGGSRKVYKINNKSKYDFLNKHDGSIIKVASMKNSIKTNRRESQAWQAVKDTKIGKYFCPITSIGPDHKYIIMKEANKIDRTKAEKLATYLQEYISSNTNVSNDIKEKYDEKYESMISYSYDIKYDNIGIYKDKPVLIDYPFGGIINIES